MRCRTISQKQLRDLEEEIQLQKCLLVSNGEGKVVRIVSAVRMSIINPDGQVLAQIGKRRNGTVRAECLIVGTKVRLGETPDDAFSRLLVEDFHPIANFVSLVRKEQTITEKKSQMMGLPTKVTSYAYISTLTEPLDKLVDRCDSSGLDKCIGRVTPPVFIFRGGRTFEDSSGRADSSQIRLFAWLSHQEVAHLKTAEGHKSLEDCLIASFRRTDDKVILSF